MPLTLIFSRFKGAKMRLVLATIILAVAARASDPVKDAFGRRFAIVLREGLAAGICNVRDLSSPAARMGQTDSLTVRINGERADYEAAQTGLGAFAEVEASLGIPETRADLGEKVL